VKGRTLIGVVAAILSCEVDADKKAEMPERALEGSAGSMRVQQRAHQTEPAIGDHFDLTLV
jgi:hypothetical protein